MTTQEILQGVHDWTNGKIVYDISVAHPDGQGNPTKYADLAAALGTNGANIPQNLRKGGMSVKYAQSSDNKYVRFRYTLQYENTTVGNNAFVNVNNWIGENSSFGGYYTCSSVGGATTKVIDAPDFSLTPGSSMFVVMENKITNASPEILVNNFRKTSFYYNDAVASKYNTWEDNELTEVVWDGNDFRVYRIGYDDNISIFDITAYTGNNYATLDSAIAAIPMHKQKKGMSIRFFDSTKNRYVQHRCTYSSYTSNSTYWQGVDSVPTKNSKNLVESGGVVDALGYIRYKDDAEDERHYSSSNYDHDDNGTAYGWVFPVEVGDIIKVQCTWGNGCIANVSSSVNNAFKNQGKVQTIKTDYTKEAFEAEITVVGYFYVIVHAENNAAFPESDVAALKSATTIKVIKYGNVVAESNASLNKAISANSSAISANKQAEEIWQDNLDTFVGRGSATIIEIKVVDNLILSGNSDSAAFMKATFEPYIEQRGSDYIRGSKYISKIYDIRGLEGEKINTVLTPRVNYSLYAFFNNIDWYGVRYATADDIVLVERCTSTKTNKSQEITVPVGAKYFVIAGTDEESCSVNIQRSLLSRIKAIEDSSVADLYDGGIMTSNEVVSETHSTKGSRIGNHYALTPENINSTFYLRVNNPNGLQIYVWIGKRVPQYYTTGDKLYGLIDITTGNIDIAFAIKEDQKSEALNIIVAAVESEGSFTVELLSYKDSVKANALKIKGAKDDITQLGNKCTQLNTDVMALKDVALPGDSIVKLNNVVETLQKINCAKKAGYYDTTVKSAPLMLLHFSDIHNQPVNLGRVKDFAQHYNTYIDDVICTGDLVYSHLLPAAENMAFWQNADVDNFLICVGNHDMFGEEEHTMAPLSDVYNALIAPYISSWGSIVQPTNAAQNGLLYYYKDYADSKVRMIVLDAYTHDVSDYRNNQTTWLDSVLADAITNNMSVLCAIHQCAGNLTKFDCAFSTKELGVNQSDIPLVFKQSIDTFINNGGDFIAWFGGHTHRDICGVDSTYTNQVKIVIGQAQVKEANSEDMYRSLSQSDKTRDLFNLMAIDTYHKTIKLIRIGADMDLFLRKRDTLCIQYASSEAHTITAPIVISENGI